MRLDVRPTNGHKSGLRASLYTFKYIQIHSNTYIYLHIPPYTLKYKKSENEARRKTPEMVISRVPEHVYIHSNKSKYFQIPLYTCIYLHLL